MKPKIEYQIKEYFAGRYENTGIQRYEGTDLALNDALSYCEVLNQRYLSPEDDTKQRVFAVFKIEETLVGKSRPHLKKK